MYSPICRTPEEKKQKGEDCVKKKKIIILAGPTATGKTALSLKLAQILGGEIISADSMQVYRGLDIGTAKATLEEQRAAPHYLLDIRDVDEPYNVASYYHDARAAIEDIHMKDKVAIVVGGNGFYIHSLIYGPPQGPPSVPEIRKKIEEDLEKFGVELLFAKISQLDPDYAKTITLQDRHKIVRALEIMTLTNQRVTDFPKPGSEKTPLDLDFHCWFIYYSKPILYKRIEERCDKMLEEGLIGEVVRMKEQGLLSNTSACNAIGYRQALDFLETDLSSEAYSHFVREFKKASRHYAKRQFTWFKKEPLFNWIDLEKIPPDLLLEYMIRDFEE
jgi:tRNA dimethylallyltransferase